jgi:serine/threonine-protein kinase
MSRVVADERDRWSRFLSTPIDAVAANVMAASWVGRRFGTYEIVAPLGAGGMGEVYRARDHRLGRDVAVKVLPASFVTDHERRLRFEREARLLAALSHPHIATIYGVDDVDGGTVLVLEFVDGENLAERIARGPIVWREALGIARQVAEALEGAHDKGIIHRDLKPSNIALTRDGIVKVLDFGLAKASEAAAANLSESPTLTSGGTNDGVLLGTAAYMSPEQARGQSIDKRSDIWAFGCVLYEMLTGRRAFAGETASDYIAAILERQPDWTHLPSSTPPQIQILLEGCLEKDLRQRRRDIGDVRLEIDKAMSRESAGRDAVPGHRRRLRNWRFIGWTAVVTAVSIIALLAITIDRTRHEAPMQLTIDLGAEAPLPLEVGANLALSPDGRTLAFTSLKPDLKTTQLYVRNLSQLHAVPLQGTEHAHEPFFSPNGQFVGFFDDASRKLKKVAIAGGAPVTLADASDPRGGTWTDDDAILFQPTPFSGRSLMRVPAGGGQAEPYLNAPATMGSIRWPQQLPGGRTVLYTAGVAAQFDSATVAVQSVGASPKIIVRNGYFGRYVPTGHVLYVHDNTLFAVPFDLTRLDISGRPIAVVEGISASGGTGAAQFAASPVGTLTYVPGQRPLDVISWLDRSGRTSPLRVGPGIWSFPTFSPDGQRLAMQISDGTRWDIWQYEWTRDTSTRLTLDPTNATSPVWTPNGRRLTFASSRAGNAPNLFWQRVDGIGEAERLTDGSYPQRPTSWHPTGKFLVFTERRPDTNLDIMILPMIGNESSGWKPGSPYVFLNSSYDEDDPVFSPSGRWIAYDSTETGRTEVFVRPFPGPGGKVQISSGGGHVPQWSPAKRELFYRDDDGRLMVTGYTESSALFQAEKPQLWSMRSFPANLIRPMQRGPFAVHPDGERLALFVPPDVRPGGGNAVLVLGFFEQLRPTASRPSR